MVQQQLRLAAIDTRPLAVLPLLLPGQAGEEPEAIASTLEQLSSQEPPVLDVLQPHRLPDPLPRHRLRLHMPPRVSAKLAATMRHAAAKAVAQLGLSGAGLVRVSGWLALQPDWQGRYKLPPEALLKMPDYDAREWRLCGCSSLSCMRPVRVSVIACLLCMQCCDPQEHCSTCPATQRGRARLSRTHAAAACRAAPAGQLRRMAADEADARASEPLPLAQYVDEELHLPDLSAFDPAARCMAEGNGEGDVLLAALDVDVPLHAASLAGLQVRWAAAPRC